MAVFASQLEFLIKEYDEKPLTLVIRYNKMQTLNARHRGIPSRLPKGARYKSYDQWIQNEFFENPRVKSQSTSGKRRDH